MTESGVNACLVSARAVGEALVRAVSVAVEGQLFKAKGIYCLEVRFDIFLQGEVHKTDDVGAFIDNDETKTALEDAGYGRYKVWVWICTLGLNGANQVSIQPFFY